MPENATIGNIAHALLTLHTQLVREEVLSFIEAEAVLVPEPVKPDRPLPVDREDR
ncbi:MAG: hypothetical protein AAF848_00515 [Pseudomonadota bacterium]